MSDPSLEAPSDFIREIIEADLRAGRHQTVVTRFPPEPNGYLHIGHSKSICLNFGLAEQFGGRCHLRFDDSNPTTEDMQYVEAIQRDIRWLGFDWGEHPYFASDYFDKLYDYALELIKAGKAYVCSLGEAEIREYRGTVTTPGRPGPGRERSVEENLELFADMRAGRFKDGEHVLRARIDMASPNMKMRDPLLYRIRHKHHYRTGDKWCIYPLYDFTHCLSDSIEGITHSICTLEFENNRELYDWILDNLDVPQPRPHQYEFARLNLNYTVMSKRRFLELVSGSYVSGWDDPRMPTLAGIRRRGVTPEAMRHFATRVGVAKNNSTVELALFEHTLREDLSEVSPRVMGVLKPLKVVIENYPEGQTEQLDAPYWPHDIPKEGSRKLPFGRELFIEADDFMEQPAKKWFRLAPGREVRLRHAYIIKCERVVKDDSGAISELRCSYDRHTRGENAPGARKVKGTLHWVSAAHALDAEVRIYDRLFSMEFPGSDGQDFKQDLNPDSLQTVRAKLEPSLSQAEAGERYQLERLGFFYVDPIDSKDGAPVLNRTVGLRDTWAKIAARAEPAKPAKPAASKPKADEAAAAAKTTAALPPEAQALIDAHGLAPGEARVLGASPTLGRVFAAAVAAGAEPRAAASWLVSELPAALEGRDAESVKFDGTALAELVALLDAGTISRPAAKDVLVELVKSGGSPRAIVEQKGLQQMGGDALGPVVDKVLADNASLVERYKAGNPNLLGALVGQVMRASGGKADPKLAGEMLRERLA